MKPTAILFAISLSSAIADETWQRFQIYDDTRLCNGLDASDVNKDGLTDYVTNFEDTGKVVVMLHPGNAEATKPWPTVQIGKFGRVESSCFGDLDGDGFPDVAIAHGREDGDEVAGVSIVWNPGKDAVSDPAQWHNSDLVPSSLKLGNYLFIRAHDIDGDGALDLVVGGRTEGHAGNKIKTEGLQSVGIRWFEAPSKPEHRREMSRWKRHDIDTEIISGHGFEIGDFNKDGRPDIALANADWGTPEDEKQVLWYEHPSEGETWKKHVIYTNKDFYTKPGIVAEDFDGDGRADLLTQLDDRVLFFKNNGSGFETLEIPKAPQATWRSRPLAIADLDSDGKKEIVIGVIHRNGDLPKTTASMAIMSYSGDKPASDNFTTKVIKWGDGFVGGSMWKGEKWDNIRFEDIDGDGHPDIVANCEEYEPLGVEWFRNPGN